MDSSLKTGWYAGRLNMSVRTSQISAALLWNQVGTAHNGVGRWSSSAVSHAAGLVADTKDG